MTKKSRDRRPAQYSDEEFQAIVSIIQNDPQVRADIEAITGQSLDGKSPRELFTLFRAIGGAAAVQEAVARFGRARRALRRTRIELAEDAVEHIADHPDVTQIARQRIVELEAKLDELRGENRRLRASNQALARARAASPAVAARVIKGEVSA